MLFRSTGFLPSITSSYTASKADYKTASPICLPKQGLRYEYFEGNFSRVADIREKGLAVSSGICEQISLAEARTPDHYGLIFSGYLYAPVDGIYRFSTRSDDGSVLRLNGHTVVDNDGSHADIKAVGRIALKKGFHPVELLYFEDYEGESLSVSWTMPNRSKEEIITPEYFYFN